MILAEPRGRVAVIQQDSPDGGFVLGDDAVVPGEAAGLLGDDAEAGRVMVAPRDQSGTRRRAQRRGEDPIVAQALVGDPVHRWCRDYPAEGARHAEAGVVGDDQQHVGRTPGWHDARSPPGFGLQGIVFDHAPEFRIGRRELLSGDGGRGARRSWNARRLLSQRGDRRSQGYGARGQCRC